MTGHLSPSVQITKSRTKARVRGFNRPEVTGTLEMGSQTANDTRISRH